MDEFAFSGIMRTSGGDMLINVTASRVAAPPPIFDSSYKGVYLLDSKSSEFVPPTRPTTPIISHGGGGWKAKQVNDPVVFVDPTDATKLCMIFMGGDNAPIASRHWSLGRATATVSGFSESSTWTEDAGNPVLDETHGIRADCAVIVGTTIYLFATAYRSPVNTIDVYASADGGATWGAATTVLTQTGHGRSDAGYIGNASVLAEGTSWTMFYNTSLDNSGFTARKRRATFTGTDPRGTWAKQTPDDLFVVGSTGTPDAFQFEWSQLFKRGDYYMCLYEAAPTVSPFESPGNTTRYALHLAWSLSLSSGWKKSGVNPVYPPSDVVGRFDEFHAATGAIYQINGVDYLFHCGGSDAPQDIFDIAVAKLNSAPETMFLPGLTDSADSANPLVVTGGTIVAGYTGNALRFDGNARAGSITVPTTAINNFTLEALVRATTLPQNGFIAFNGADNMVTGGKGYGIGIGDALGGIGSKLCALLSSVAWIDSGHIVTDTDWHKYALIREAGTIKFYVDGVQTPNTSAATPIAPIECFMIGCSGAGRRFIGDIDDVRVSDVVRAQ